MAHYYVDTVKNAGRKPYRVVRKSFERVIPIRDRCNREKRYFTEQAAQAAADRLNGKAKP